MYAYVRDEETSTQRYFVYVRSDLGQSIFACRFAWKSNAEKVANEINRSYASEGSLTDHASEVA